MGLYSFPASEEVYPDQWIWSAGNVSEMSHPVAELLANLIFCESKTDEPMSDPKALNQDYPLYPHLYEKDIRIPFLPGPDHPVLARHSAFSRFNELPLHQRGY